MSDRIKTAIVGCGGIVSARMTGYRTIWEKGFKYFDLAAMCDIVEESAQKRADEAEAVLKDKKTVLSCCGYCDSEYGVGGYFVGVPAVIGKNGVEKVLELELNNAEQAQFEKSLTHVKQLVKKVDELL